MQFLRDLMTVILLAVITVILICTTGFALDKWGAWNEPTPAVLPIQLSDRVDQCLMECSEIHEEIRKLSNKLDDAMGVPSGSSIGTET